MLAAGRMCRGHVFLIGVSILVAGSAHAAPDGGVAAGAGRKADAGSTSDDDVTQEAAAAMKAMKKTFGAAAAGRLQECRRFVGPTATAEPKEAGLRETCAHHLYRAGESLAAAQLLEGATGKDSATVDFLLKATRIRVELAQDGPNVSRNADFVSYKPTKDPEADKRWIASQWAAAEHSVRRALTIEPLNPDALSLLVIILDKGGKPEKALALLASVPDLVGRDSTLAARKGLLLAEMGHAPDAIVALRAALRLDSRGHQLWQALGAMYKRQGDQAAAEDANRRARFFRLLLSSSSLEYSPERAEKVELLATHFDNERSAKAELWEKLFAQLEKAGDSEAAEILAAFAHWHSHDQAEERAWAALQKQGQAAIPVLVRLVREAESKCTIRAGLAALSELRAPETLQLATDMLESDSTALFPLGAAQALGRLGDKRAAVHLTRIAGCAVFVDSPVPPDASPWAQGEAILALGVLGGEEAAGCLSRLREKGTQPTLVAVARCLMTAEAGICDAAVKAAKATRKHMFFEGQSILRAFGDASDGRPALRPFITKLRRIYSAAN